MYTTVPTNFNATPRRRAAFATSPLKLTLNAIALSVAMLTAAASCGASAAETERPASDASAPAPAKARYTVQLPDGGIYRGPLRQGKLSGKGRIDWAGNRHYVGNFVDGYMQGQGTLTTPNFTYVGQFLRGDLNGQGRMVSRDGMVYEGQFVHDLRQGYGKLSDGHGFSFEGQFKDDKPDGQGRLTNSDGLVIEGKFTSDFMAEGPVVMTNARGLRYEGPVEDNMPNGQGALTRGDKAVVRGAFRYGMAASPATITYADGAVYTGEVVNNQAQGTGELLLPNGDVYQGRFRSDKFNGQGQLKHKDGTVQQGAWRAGKFVDATQDAAQDDTPDDTPELAARNNEAVLYNQQALLRQQFDQLQASQAGAPPRLYALFVAGDGREEVFRREVTFADTLFARRFGTRGHSVSLVNSRSTATRLPLATAHSIELALGALAGKMNRDRDLLLVFLTSHGSPEHELALGMPRLLLPDLPAARLGELLKASGIRNQVVVVSACYSGGFADAVKGERTWFIAAARADRTSFGCADDNDFTYFGRALLKDSLPSAATLTEAFEHARELVDQWETNGPPTKSDADDEEGSESAANNDDDDGDDEAAATAPASASKLQHSEPFSIVTPAFRAEVDALWRSHPPVPAP